MTEHSDLGLDAKELDEIEFPPEMTPADVLEHGKALLAHARAQLIEINRKSTSRQACQRFSKFHDALLKALFKHVAQKFEAEGKEGPGSLCLMALGGYGRRELCLHSDVDILFVTGEKKPSQEEFIKQYLHTLFDWRLEVGYGVRRIEDCLLTINTDLESVTAMMESRFLIGSKPLFTHFQEAFYRALRGGGRRWFLQNRLTEWKERQERYENSLYLLEPNLKESKGGLRDIHNVRWLLLFQSGSGELSQLEDAGIISQNELRHLRQAEEFILKLRNELHALNPRKGDVLTFQAQVEITKLLGYEGTETMLAEEALMHEYYRRAREIAKFTNRAAACILRNERSTLGAMLGSLKRKRIDKHLLQQDGAIFVDDKFPNYLKEDPVRIMALFAKARKLGLRVSERTRDAIQAIVPKIEESFAEDQQAAKHFMEIMRGPENVARTLADMHDCGFLSAFIPEFARITCMVRMDHYHRYTVDEHLIKAVEIAERLGNEPKDKRTHPAQVLNEIKRRDLLNFSLLLHDVGKGFGKGHALRGGQIIQRIGQRMGLEHDDIEMLRFLVLSHLKINHVSQRRDLDDPAVARQMAKEIGDLDRLKMLYVHSVCDLMAVSPEAWTEWKAQLYEVCYRVTARALEGAEAGHDVEPPATPMQKRVWEFLLNHPEKPITNENREQMEKRLEEFIESVPDRYLQATHPQYIAEHFRLLLQLDEKNKIEWSLDTGHGLSELTVCSADMPGTFAMVCGALAAKDINIWSAQIFSTLDGYAINRFQVTDLENKPLPAGFRLERLRADINQVMLGKKTIEELIAKYQGHSAQKRPPDIARRASEIWIDNEASKQFSVLEIRTWDRPGLLFSIATVLDRHKLNIYRAMLNTEAYGVIDVFYITDLEFNKLHDETQISRLVADLKLAIDGPAAEEPEPAEAVVQA